MTRSNAEYRIGYGGLPYLHRRRPRPRQDVRLSAVLQDELDRRKELGMSSIAWFAVGLILGSLGASWLLLSALAR